MSYLLKNSSESHKSPAQLKSRRKPAFLVLSQNSPGDCSSGIEDLLSIFLSSRKENPKGVPFM